MANLQMKGLNALEFMQREPLMELQLPMQAVFPTVLALEQAKMREKLDDIVKSSGALESAKTSMPRMEKETSKTQRSEKQETKNERENSSYSLVYFNPETKKAEVVEGKVSISYQDEAERVIEEGLGMRSASGMYSMVATPLIREEVDEQRMKEIMDKIKIESPSPFGGGAAVQINYAQIDAKVKEKYAEEIVAIEIAERRKITLEERLESQIKIVDELQKNLEKGGTATRELMERLPPLSHERMLVLFRDKKRISKKQIGELLLKDYQFLKAVKSKISAMRVQDILKVVLKMNE